MSFPNEEEGQAKAAQEEQSGYTLAEMQEKINTDSAFRDAYLQNPQEYEARIVEESTAPPQEGAELTPQGERAEASEGAAPAEPFGAAGEEEIEITTRIPRALLGTYAVNRAPNEALVEALKGLGEKDRVIEFLKQKTPDEGVGLKRRLEEFRAEQARTSKLDLPDEIELDDTPVSLDDIVADETLYDPENAGKLLGAVKQLAKQNQQMREVIKKTTDGTRKALVEQKTAELHKKSAALTEEVRQAEISQIGELQKLDPALKTPKPFAELDLEVDAFYKSVAAAAGANPADPAAIGRAVSRYYGQGADAESLRAACAQNRILPPEGIEAHGAIMRLYTAREEHKNRVKSSLKERFGRDVADYEIVDMVPSYGELYARQIVTGGGLAALQARARAEGARQAVSAAPDLTKVARELPPDRGAPNLTLDNVRQEDLAKLLNKPTSTYTLDEALLAKQYYDAVQMPPPDGLLPRIQQLRPGG